MKLNRVKQISIVMAAADVVDNGLSVSRNNVPEGAGRCERVDGFVYTWKLMLRLYAAEDGKI